MLKDSGFSGTLDKMSSITRRISRDSEETVAKTILKIKVVLTGEEQYFLQSFQEKSGITDFKNVQSIFDVQVWDKVGIDVEEYQGNEFEIEFDNLVFNARLNRIDITKKLKNAVTYTYTLTFEKEDNATEDSILVNSYLRKLTRDCEDKIIPQLFNIYMKPVETDKSDSSEII